VPFTILRHAGERRERGEKDERGCKKPQGMLRSLFAITCSVSGGSGEPAAREPSAGETKRIPAPESATAARPIRSGMRASPTGVSLGRASAASIRACAARRRSSSPQASSPSRAASTRAVSTSCCAPVPDRARVVGELLLQCLQVLTRH
jgi:hypothetical protein